MDVLSERLRAALADRYAIEREVGRGGMAVVYLARDVKHDRRIALKVLRPELAATLGADRFLREIRIAAQLQHPHILQLFDSGSADGFLYYVMPYVEGESLRQRLARAPDMVDADLVRVLRDVADALAYAHERGVVHRDIKPDNVMLSGRHALVADFGVAKALMASTTGSNVTTEGVALGTPAYMAPEQAAGVPNVDHRADIYSMGAMAYEMVTGRPPFEGESAQQVLASHVTQPPTPVSALSPATPPLLAGLIMRCLEKQPADRWQSAAELLSVLEALTTPSGGITPTGARAIATRGSPRWRGIVVAAVAGAAALGVGLTIIWNGSPAPSSATQRQVTYTGNVLVADVSPDGQFLAYVANTGGMSTITVQDLASGSKIDLVTTRHFVCCLDWSPDAREVLVGGVDSTGRSAVVAYPRLGGTPRAFPTFFQSVWSADGRQVVSWGATSNWVSFYTPATGDSTAISLADTMGWLVDVEQGPSGNLVAVLRSEKTSDSSRIQIMAIDSALRYAPLDPAQQSRPPASFELLVKDAAQLAAVRWSHSGDALYYLRRQPRGFALWKQRVRATGRARSNPALLLSSIDVRDDTRLKFSLTSDGRTLVYVKGLALSNLWRGRMVRGAWQLDQLTAGTARDRAPRLSPDGQLIAYLNTVGDRTQVFLLPAGGGEPRQLTTLDSVLGDGTAAWSPDGRSLAFGIRRGGANRVAVVSRDGHDVHVFDRTDLSGNGTIEWAPGREILYQIPSVQNFRFLDVATGRERPLLVPDSAAVGWPISIRYSPDGTRAAVFWNRVNSTDAGLYVLVLGTGETHRLVRGAVYPLGWSDDGRTLYAVDQDKQQVIAVPARAGAPHKVGSFSFMPEFEGSSHRGEQFVLEARGTRGDVWRVDAFDPDPR